MLIVSLMTEMSPTLPDLSLGRPALELEAKLFSGLADRKRLELLRLLQGGPRLAGELAHEAGLTSSGASNHLRCLLECGLVSVESDGRFNRYRLAEDGVNGWLREAEQRLARVRHGIEACHYYGPPSRRALRRNAGATRSPARAREAPVSAVRIRRDRTLPPLPEVPR